MFMKNQEKQRLIFIALCVIIVIVGVVIFFIATRDKDSGSSSTRQTTSVNTPSDQDFIALLMSKIADPNNVKIVSVKEPSTGWFVVEVATKDGSSDNAWALFYRNTLDNLSLSDGPSTSFDSDALIHRGVPKEVRAVLVGE